MIVDFGMRRLAFALLVLGLTLIGAPAAGTPGDGMIEVRVIKDSNGNGVYDPGVDPGQMDIPVTLTDPDGLVLETRTDSLGLTAFAPAFSDLSGGRYRVEASRPGPPLTYIRPAKFGDWVQFVDVRAGRYENVVIGVIDPDDFPPSDRTVQIGGRAWYDTRADGIQQPDEEPAAAVSCTIRDGYTEAVTLTDADGRYVFYVEAGIGYRVVCTPPDGYTPTLRRAGTSRTIDSDADQSGSMRVRPHRRGNNDTTYDLGFVLAANAHTV